MPAVRPFRPSRERCSPTRRRQSASPWEPWWPPSWCRARSSAPTPGGQADGYKKTYVANAKNTRQRRRRLAGCRHDLPARRDAHPPQRPRRRRARPQPQRPGDQELGLPLRADHRRRDGRPDHPDPGTLAAGRRRRAAQPDRARPDPRPGQRHPRGEADQPLQHVQRLLRPAVRDVRPLADRHQRAHLRGRLGERGHPALLQADRARPLHALQPRAPLPRRRRRHRGVRRCRPARAATGSCRCPRPASSPSRSPARATSPTARPTPRSRVRRPRCACTCAPAVPTSPRSPPTSRATRSPASAACRRRADSSTRTPTAWPSSSSAATCTAAGRGRRTAWRWPSATAPTTT